MPVPTFWSDWRAGLPQFLRWQPSHIYIYDQATRSMMHNWRRKSLVDFSSTWQTYGCTKHRVSIEWKQSLGVPISIMKKNYIWDCKQGFLVIFPVAGHYINARVRALLHPQILLQPRLFPFLALSPCVCTLIPPRGRCRDQQIVLCSAIFCLYFLGHVGVDGVHSLMHR